MHIMEKDPMSGKQWRYTDYEGNAMGNADGLMELHDGSSAILEIKSMNDQKFKDFVKKGVKLSPPNTLHRCNILWVFQNVRKQFLFLTTRTIRNTTMSGLLSIYFTTTVCDKKLKM